MRRATILLAALAVVTASPATASADTFGLTFPQRGGATLRTMPGYLGFKTATGWAKATTLVSTQPDGTALVATDDPAGRRLAVRVTRRAGSGVIAVQVRIVNGPTADVSAMRIGFAAPPGERMYGLGERSIA